MENKINFKFPKAYDLRYGENPHQKAAVYFDPSVKSPMSSLKKITGQDLSYVNFTDILAGIESVRIFSEPCVVVNKHNSACGIALGDNAAQALDRAIKADPMSAFGGVVIFNKPIDLKTAKLFASFKEENGILIDIIAAPDIAKDAKEFLSTIRKKTGIYTFGKLSPKHSQKYQMKAFDGGIILQEWDKNTAKDFANWQIKGKYKPTKKQLEQMKIGWKFIGRIKSNTVIIIDKDIPMTRGIGSGQTSRVGATKIALEQAKKSGFVKNAILVSDSFFPFNDSVKLAAEYGIGAILEQGGSVQDQASIDAANDAKIPIVFTGKRAFWH